MACLDKPLGSLAGVWERATWFISASACGLLVRVHTPTLHVPDQIHAVERIDACFQKGPWVAVFMLDYLTYLSGVYVETSMHGTVCTALYWAALHNHPVCLLQTRLGGPSSDERCSINDPRCWNSNNDGLGFVVCLVQQPLAVPTLCNVTQTVSTITISVCRKSGPEICGNG